jgi:glycine hydroxymethyltransferase
MARVLTERGLRIVTGGDDSHMFLVDLRSKKITGKEAEVALGRAQITINKNAIPHDPEKPTVTSGLRIGAAAMTTRDFGEPRRFLSGGGAPLGFTRAHGRSSLSARLGL